MTLKSSVAVISLFTAFSWAAWAAVLLLVPPKSAGLPGEALFLAALFLATTGTFTVLGVIGRARGAEAAAATHLVPAFRQGLLLSIAVTAFLLLRRADFLRWWNIFLLGLTLLLLDMALSGKKIEHAN